METIEKVQDTTQQSEAITPDTFVAYLESDEGKRLLQPKLDQYFTKGLDSWKRNNLQKLVDEEVSKRFPSDTPEQKALKELQAELDRMKKEKALEAVRNKALKFSTEKQLPIELVELLVSHEEETTFKNLEVVESVFASHVQKLVDAEVKKRLSESGQNVTAGKGNGVAVNPFKRETLNLTEQGRLWRENPELARKLQTQANA